MKLLPRSVRFPSFYCKLLVVKEFQLCTESVVVSSCHKLQLPQKQLITLNIKCYLSNKNFQLVLPNNWLLKTLHLAYPNGLDKS